MFEAVQFRHWQSVQLRPKSGKEGHLAAVAAVGGQAVRHQLVQEEVCRRLLRPALPVHPR